ncbi:MAG: response regulator transcription factor [Caulobacterales bacterium]|jgi:DNA-binding response OmpR family regulator
MSTPAPSSSTQPIARILIVDDQPDNIQVLARRLTTRRFEVHTSENGMDGGRKALTEQLDLVLLDVMMPRMSGLDVVREIRKVKSAVQLPIIMLTARDDSETLVEALSAGANDYIVKPFDFDITLARIVAQLRVRASFQAINQDRARLKRQLDDLAAVSTSQKA